MKLILRLARLAYGQCTHPAIVFRNGRPYCTECGQLRG